MTTRPLPNQWLQPAGAHVPLPDLGTDLLRASSG
jgi:hypothetical protein